MNTVPSSAALRELLKLTERREALLEELAGIEAKINSTLHGRPSPTGTESTVKGARKKAAKSGKHGKAKEAILSVLRPAGKTGVSVKDIAAQTGRNASTIHVWFATTGKKYAEKVQTGVYRLKANVA